MPYKFNESRRHKIPKAIYRVTNRPEYDAALNRVQFENRSRPFRPEARGSRRVQPWRLPQAERCCMDQPIGRNSPNPADLI